MARLARDKDNPDKTINREIKVKTSLEIRLLLYLILLGVLLDLYLRMDQEMFILMYIIVFGIK
jgi:hypothetical protein